MLHPLATASASSANPSTKAMSSAIPLVRTAAFHCSKHTGPSCFREPPTKILRKCEHRSDGRVTLDKMLQIGCLLSRAALCGSHHHKCNTSRRRRLVPDNGLFRDRARSSGTKGAQPHLKCTLRSRVSPPRQFPRTTWLRYGTLGSIAKPGRKGKDQRWKKSEIVVAEVEAFLVREHGRHWTS